jgi:pimeloyl-ACP methyl ester carboxylesterase
MPATCVNGIEMWYELRGSGPLLALSHGWLGPTEDWPPGIIESLSEDLTVLVYDVRGHGRTQAPEDIDAYSMPQYARDLAALLDALDIERAHIGGVSQGGMIAAQFVCDFSERARSFLLCDSTAGNGAYPGSGGEFERAMQRYFDWMSEYASAYGLESLARERARLSRERDPHYFEFPVAASVREAKDVRQHTRMSLAAFLGTARAIRQRPDLTARLPELRMPALVVAGEWDGFYPCAERDHALLRASRFVRVRNCGHASPDWRPDAFLKAVTEFIADVEACRPVAGEIEL